MSATATDRQREYRDVYLRSDHWRRMRALALEDAEHRCAVCNNPKQLDVHHRTYERIGKERLTDLLVLCRKCHDLFHAAGRLAGSNVSPQSPPADKPTRAKGPRSATPKQLRHLISLGDRPPSDLTFRQAKKRIARWQSRSVRATVRSGGRRSTGDVVREWIEKDAAGQVRAVRLETIGARPHDR